MHTTPREHHTPGAAVPGRWEWVTVPGLAPEAERAEARERRPGLASALTRIVYDWDRITVDAARWERTRAAIRGWTTHATRAEAWGLLPDLAPALLVAEVLALPETMTPTPAAHLARIGLGRDGITTADRRPAALPASDLRGDLVRAFEGARHDQESGLLDNVVRARLARNVGDAVRDHTRAAVLDALPDAVPSEYGDLLAAILLRLPATLPAREPSRRVLALLATRSPATRPSTPRDRQRRRALLAPPRHTAQLRPAAPRAPGAPPAADALPA